jgi:hypothetical protein
MHSRSPLAANALLLFLLLVAIAVGGAAGSWILPVVLTVVHDGWRAVPTIPVAERIFGGEPVWLSPKDASFVSVVSGLLAFAGMIGASMLAMRAWRFVAVKKLCWITDQDVDEMNRRDPGF